jgi:hypothetical protein
VLEGYYPEKYRGFIKKTKMKYSEEINADEFLRYHPDGVVQGSAINQPLKPLDGERYKVKGLTNRNI